MKQGTNDGNTARESIITKKYENEAIVYTKALLASSIVKQKQTSKNRGRGPVPNIVLHVKTTAFSVLNFLLCFHNFAYNSTASVRTT